LRMNLRSTSMCLRARVQFLSLLNNRRMVRPLTYSRAGAGQSRAGRAA
jgi:hypothetical protein